MEEFASQHGVDPARNARSLAQENKARVVQTCAVFVCMLCVSCGILFACLCVYVCVCVLVLSVYGCLFFVCVVCLCVFTFRVQELRTALEGVKTDLNTTKHETAEKRLRELGELSALERTRVELIGGAYGVLVVCVHWWYVCVVLCWLCVCVFVSAWCVCV